MLLGDTGEDRNDDEIDNYSDDVATIVVTMFSETPQGKASAKSSQG
jgi:hypothetical protein